MAEKGQLSCELITPDRSVLDTKATSVVFPAHDGEVGVLRNRAPLLFKMGIGVCRISTAGQTKRYYVDGGFARMLNNCLTLLTEDARSADEIDRPAAEQALSEARDRSATDTASQEERRRAIQRASAQIKTVAG
jgi:F-type H+-transporting ATPase subunit epsilon